MKPRYSKKDFDGNYSSNMNLSKAWPTNNLHLFLPPRSLSERLSVSPGSWISPEIFSFKLPTVSDKDCTVISNTCPLRFPSSTFGTAMLIQASPSRNWSSGMRTDSSSFCLLGSGSSGSGGASSGGGGGGIPWGIGGGGTIFIPGWDMGWGTKARGTPRGSRTVYCSASGGSRTLRTVLNCAEGSDFAVVSTASAAGTAGVDSGTSESGGCEGCC
nr:hypothetical protein Iba_chr03cCG0930 [Ipomoea batatas]